MSNIRHIPSLGLDATVQRHKRKLADMGLNVTRKVEDILARGEDFAMRTATQVWGPLPSHAEPAPEPIHLNSRHMYF